MLDLISEIFLSLSLALAAGFLLGWALARRAMRSQADIARRKLQKSGESTREELAYANSRMRQLESELEQLHREKFQWANQWQDYQAALMERDAQLVRLQGQVEVYQSRLAEPTPAGSGCDNSLQTISEQLTTLLERVAPRNTRRVSTGRQSHRAGRTLQPALEADRSEAAPGPV
jgi:chromosome segregation ATPase